jgi:hypothetical protein
MPNYCEAVEVAGIARELIRNYHPALGEAKIVYLFRDKAPESKGKITRGTAKKTNPIEQALTGYDYIIWIAEDVWGEIGQKEKEALVDHELSHCGLDENGKWTIYEHDFEGFNAVLKRHGYWKGELKQMKRTMEQLSLFEKKPLKVVGDD